LTPERWKRAEDLFHAARARPPGERAAFIAEACPEDDALRRDVESLLSEPVSDDGFLAVPTLGMAVDLDSEPATVDMTGRTLGGYRLELLIGAGGMGEVYLARDATLGRDVAIKILPRAFTSHPDRLARFEREARMLAALNHPNICAIYGFEAADPPADSGQAAIRFLILELVEGETLADTLAQVSLREGAGLPLRQALTVARQIAEAVEVAHDKGIIHRDLKPANIKITPDGVVKVLDFGLAKAVSADGSSPDLTQPPDATAGGRREGVVMGTARYMSPEQARGQSVDKRTDIWAFGCVLYEMLTGRVTFPGDTASDTIAKILEREPDWAALPPTLRPGVVTLLKRCLEKDAKRRLRDIGDARIELDDALNQPAPSDVQSLAAPSLRWSRLAPPALALVGLTALIVGFWPRWENPLANATFEKLTNWEGSETGAQISPDGNFVVFLADKDGESDLWLSQVGAGEPANLTRNISSLAPQAGLLRTFGFTGDGEIWFSLSEAASQQNMAEAPIQQKLIMPLAGGATRPFLSPTSFGASWSSDGTRLVYFDNRSGDPLSIADRGGGDPRRIFEPPEEQHNHNPIWSADDEWIYFLRGVPYGLNETDEMDVWRVRPVAGGRPEQVTRQNAAMTFLTPLDRRTLLCVARDADRSGPWLWTLDVRTRAWRRVSSGVEQYTSVSASRDGRRVVATLANPTVSLFRVALDGPGDERDVQPLTVPGARALAPRVGGEALFYLSSRGTGDGLSRLDEGKASEIWKASDGALSEPPAISADGRRVALIIRKEGQQHLHIMSADGTERRELAPSIATTGTADWSPDGRWVAAGGTDEQGWALFKIPVDGGTPIPLVRGGKFTSPVWSPVNDLIIYAGPLVAGRVPLLGVRSDGTPVELPDLRARPGGYRFLPDGTGLVHLPRGQSRDFWLFDLATKKSRQLTRLDNQGRLRAFDITRDGKYIVFDRWRENSDIVLISLPD
jgi:serine/threonine protein kinase